MYHTQDTGIMAAPQACAFYESRVLGFSSIFAIYKLLISDLPFWILGSLGVEWEDYQISLSETIPILGCASITSIWLAPGAGSEHLYISAGDKTSSSNVPSNTRMIVKANVNNISWTSHTLFFNHNQTALFQNTVIYTDILFNLKLYIHVHIKFLYTIQLPPWHSNPLALRKWLFGWVEHKCGNEKTKKDVIINA